MSGGFWARFHLRVFFRVRPGLAALLSLCFLAGAFLGFGSGRLALLKVSTVGSLGEAGQDTESIAKEAEAICLDMLGERLDALVTGDTEGLQDNYMITSESGYWAWEREVIRTKYLGKWAEKRGVTFTKVDVTFEIDSTIVDDPSTVWLELTELARYEYVYDEGRLTHSLGSRSLHVAQLVKEEGRWLIRLHWYVDPLGQCCYTPADGIAGPLNITPADGRIPASGETSSPSAPIAGYTDAHSDEEPQPEPETRFNRDEALRYAIRYSGVRVFPDVEHYNRDYRVYSYVGGDCANFVSQVLSAGGLEQGYGWHYASEGSTAWVRSDSLMWFLLSSGAGQRLYRGTFEGAITPTDEYPSGIVASLEPGDIIGYEHGGELHHVAVVVGKDPKGYVTIASHTSDRLFFPWDLGWDEGTVFWFVKITY